MDYMAELAAIANANGGIIETKTAAQHGISKAMLYKLCKAEKIHRIVKGQYILPEDMQDELLSISRRSGKVIFSHETALFLHGISDRTPFEHTVTAPSGCIPSAAIKAECKVYYIKPELFELGKTMLQTPCRESRSLLRSGAHHLRCDPQPQQDRDGDIFIGAETIRRQPQEGFEPVG